jgi:hypothetical protein
MDSRALSTRWGWGVNAREGRPFTPRHFTFAGCRGKSAKVIPRLSYLVKPPGWTETTLYRFVYIMYNYYTSKKRVVIVEVV